MSDKMIMFLIAIFFSVMVFAIIDQKWGLALYGFGGALINVSVLMMK